jgi:hypothetical protein
VSLVSTFREPLHLGIILCGGAVTSVAQLDLGASSQTGLKLFLARELGRLWVEPFIGGFRESFGELLTIPFNSQVDLLGGREGWAIAPLLAALKTRVRRAVFVGARSVSP